MNKAAPLPENEEHRLKDLYSFDLLDTPQEAEFDELLELARSVCDTPVSFISLVDKNRQWFKASTGLDIKESPRDIAFCSHTILQNQVLTVADATSTHGLQITRL